MKKIALIITIYAVTVQIEYSQSYVSGGIFSNTTWTVSGSPFIVTDTIVVFDGVTLTIEPGVTVKFDDRQIMEIRGTLKATGAKNDSIYFTSNSSTPNNQSWNGLDLGSLSTVKLDFSVVSFANPFLYNDESTSCIINNSRFSNCNAVIWNNGMIGLYDVDSTLFENNTTAVNGYKNMSFTNCTFLNNVDGLKGITEPYVYNCVFEGNTGIAIDGWGGEIRNCEIINNKIGLHYSMSGGSSAAIIMNNIITRNEIGFKIKGNNPVADFSNNAICYNTLYNVENTISYSPDLSNNCWCSTDPVYIASKIYDAYDNLSLGIVGFSSFNTDTDCMINTITGNYELCDAKLSVRIYPNPFSQSTVLEFENKNNASGMLTIFDYQGRIVRTIADISSDRIIIEKGNLISGLYFFHLSINRIVQGTGILIIK